MRLRNLLLVLLASLLLAPIGTETLATGFWAKASTFRYGAAAPYAVTILLLAAVVVLWLVG